MKSLIRLTIPFIAAFLLLGAVYYLATASTRIPNGTILVNSLQDNRINDGYCSLREAIEAANTNALVDTCPAGSADLTDTIEFIMAGTITVTDKLILTAGGPLVINGRDDITVTGGLYHVIWQMEIGSQVTLDHMITVNGLTVNNSEKLTIANSKILKYDGFIHNLGGMVIINSTFYENYGTYEGGSILNEGSMTISNTSFTDDSMYWMGTGSAIFNKGTLVIADSTFQDNVNTAIFNEGSMTISKSIFSGNQSGYNTAGAILNKGEITILESTFSGNYAATGGAGIDNWGVATIVDSTFSGNSAYASDAHGGAILNSGFSSISNCIFLGNYANYGGYGGGIFNAGVSTLTNSTFAGNSAASYGGGIYNIGVITITNSTVSENSAPSMGGNYQGNTTLINTIIANSISGNDCQPYPGPVIVDAGHNLDSDGSCNLDPAHGSLPNTEPMLSPLKDNGGPTLTYALSEGSPAIDAGDNAQCPHTDQRGFHRPRDGNHDGSYVCDIGAYELIVPVYFQNPRYLPVVVKPQ